MLEIYLVSEATLPLFLSTGRPARTLFSHTDGAEADQTPRGIPRQAGAAAAFTVDVLIYPLDTIKTRYQSQAYLATYASPAAKGGGGGGGQGGGVLAGGRRAVLFRGLYQGIGSVVLATLPAGEFGAGGGGSTAHSSLVVEGLRERECVAREQRTTG
jgi:hypothetical protein